jgi:hypothetical protein
MLTATLDNTRFKHFQFEGNKGGVTLGWMYNDDSLFLACSVCSSKDMFSKKVGRELVLERLNEEVNENTSKFSATISLEEIKEYLANNIDLSFPTLTKNKALDVIEQLELKDLNYNLYAKIATDVFFKQ